VSALAFNYIVAVNNNFTAGTYYCIIIFYMSVHDICYLLFATAVVGDACT